MCSGGQIMQVTWQLSQCSSVTLGLASGAGGFVTWDCCCFLGLLNKLTLTWSAAAGCLCAFCFFSHAYHDTSVQAYNTQHHYSVESNDTPVLQQQQLRCCSPATPHTAVSSCQPAAEQLRTCPLPLQPWHQPRSTAAPGQQLMTYATL